MKKFLFLAFLFVPVVVGADQVPIAIHTGSCGGARVTCMGFIIKKDGSIFTTKGRKRELICKNKEIADNLFDQLAAVKFTEISTNRIRHIHKYIRLEYTDHEHTVNWWGNDDVTGVLNGFIGYETDMIHSKKCPDYHPHQ